MQQITDNIIEQVKQRADIVEVVGKHAKLKRAGINLITNCLFHAEKSASLTISPQKNMYHCFGCSASGDSITFIMEHLNLDFIEAIKHLAGEYGITIPEVENSKYTPAQVAQIKEQKLSMKDTLNKCTKFYQQELQKNAQVMAYLKNKRGINDDMIELFKIGYAPDGYNVLATIFKDYVANVALKDSGMVSTNDSGKTYDRFRNRLLLPMLDASYGSTIGYNGRALNDGDNPKYLHSPASALFDKTTFLYGLHQSKRTIRDTNRVIVVEGNMDVVSMHQHGFTNTVAIQGSALTVEQVQILFKLADNITVMMDSDDAGIKATWRSLEVGLPYITDTKSMSFVFLPSNNGKCDPDSYLQENGAALLSQYVANKALPLSKVLLNGVKQHCDITNSEGKAKFLVDIKGYLDKFSAPILYVMLKQSIAELLNMEASAIEAVLNGNIKYAFAQGKVNSKQKRIARKVKKVPSIYVKPSALLHRMLIAKPILARAYKFKDDFSWDSIQAQDVTTYQLVDYLALNCDSIEDVDVMELHEGSIEDYHVAQYGGVVGLGFNDCEINILANTILASH